MVSSLAKQILRDRRAVHPGHGLAASETAPMIRKPSTGEPYAGKPPVRFGGRGGQKPSLPLSGAVVRPSGLLAPRMLWPLDCFVARAPRNDGWVPADPIASVIIGRGLIPARKRTVPNSKARFERKDLLGEPTLTERPMGHGLGDFEIKATVMIKDDSCHIAFSSSPHNLPISSTPTKVIRIRASTSG